MQIKLKRLTLDNFKGIKRFVVDIKDNDTKIFGANGTGKTTLFDSFLWLLFDKDSTGRKDFEIKTLTSEGKTLKDVEHVVEGVFEIDGTDVVLKKIHREKWVRKRGFTNEEFTGNETTYFWNDVPVKKDEYNSKIADVICDEDTFRLLSDVKYFNSLTWQQRRQMLFALVDENAIQPESEELALRLKGKIPDELRRELAASKKKLLSEIDQVPVRIDEINRTLREVQNVDDADVINNELLSIDNQLASQNTANEEFNKKLRDLNSKKSQLQTQIEDRRTEIRNLYRRKVQDDEQDISRMTMEASSIAANNDRKRSEHADLKKQIDRYETQLADLRKRYTEESDKEFSDNLQCPTCGADFSEDKKQGLIAKFNENKSKRLEEINVEGLSIKERKQKYESDYSKLEVEIKELAERENTLTQQIASLRSTLESKRSQLNDQYAKDVEVDVQLKEFNDKLKAIDQDLNTSSNTIDNSSLIERKKELISKRDAIQSSINNNTIREEQLNRIKELEAERLTQLDKLSSVEKLEFELADFIKQKVDRVELQLRELFNGVEFKMFDVQINGGIVDTCIVQRNGVPYSDLNTASKIWVSLNIIAAFSKLKNINAPIFIDNRESVTQLPPLEQQTISLVVSPEHNSLTIK